MPLDKRRKRDYTIIMKIKIESPDGKSSIIEARDSAFAKEHEAIIKIVSCTEALQPWIAVNFDATGRPAGGRTMTQSQVDFLLSQAKKAGLKISKEE